MFAAFRANYILDYAWFILIFVQIKNIGFLCYFKTFFTNTFKYEVSKIQDR